MGDEIAAGLGDPADKVRVAAALICFRHMESDREGFVRRMHEQAENLASRRYGRLDLQPEPPTLLANLATAFANVLGGGDAQPAAAAKPAAASKPAEEKKPASPAEATADQPRDPYETWLKSYQGPPWAAALRAPLEKMLAAKSADERLAATMALVPLGRAQAVLPQLYEMAQSGEKNYETVTAALPWLVWKERQAAFLRLRKIASRRDDFWQLIYALQKVRDHRHCDLLWDLLADPKAASSHAGQVVQGILEMYQVTTWYRSFDQMPPAERRMMKELAAYIKPRAESGNELQRLVALAVLSHCDPEAAVQLAEKLQADAKSGPELRNDAFQAALVMAPAAEGIRRAAATLAGNDRDRRKLALRCLVHGSQALSELRGSISLQVVNSESYSRTSGQPIVPKPPAGLKPSQVLPLLDDDEPAVAAEAGYLLALFGDPRGLPPLLRYYRGEGKNDEHAQRLVYRAVAVLDDSNQIPALKKMYAGMDHSDVSEFYWTIRIMTGPEILKFRKQIRDEVGMQRLQ